MVSHGSLGLLPTDVLPAVADWLAAEELGALCATCRRMRDACDTVWQWRRYCLRTNFLFHASSAATVAEWRDIYRVFRALPYDLQRAAHSSRATFRGESIITVTATGNFDICIQTDRPLALPPGMPYYFEVRLIRVIVNEAITVGLTQPGYPKMFQQPGWKRGSFAWHGDDAHKFSGSGHGHPVKGELPWREGEVIGCGVRRRGADVTMFFTRNGRFVGDFWSRPIPVAEESHLNFHPSIGMDHAGQTVAMNLGRAPFDFDLSTLQDTAVPQTGNEDVSDNDDDDDGFGPLGAADEVVATVRFLNSDAEDSDSSGVDDSDGEEDEDAEDAGASDHDPQG
jgi:hypothetical protein